MALGWHDPDALLAALPARLWHEWQLYAAQEPFGGHGADLRLQHDLQWQAAFAGYQQARTRKPFPPETFRSPWTPKAPAVPQSRAQKNALVQQNILDLLHPQDALAREARNL